MGMGFDEVTFAGAGRAGDSQVFRAVHLLQGGESGLVGGGMEDLLARRLNVSRSGIRRSGGTGSRSPIL